MGRLAAHPGEDAVIDDPTTHRAETYRRIRPPVIEVRAIGLYHQSSLLSVKGSGIRDSSVE